MGRSPFLLGAKTERERAQRAAAVRIGIGTCMLVTTGLARRLFGIPANQDNGATRLVARLFGVRQIVLGAWALQVQDRGAPERRLCYRLNAAVDLVDVGVLAVGGIFGEGLWRAAIMGSAFGVSEGLAWMDLLEDANGIPTD